MIALENGGPAFPVGDQGFVHRVGTAAIEGVDSPEERDHLYIAATAQAASGMTLRDYFAAHALGQTKHWIGPDDPAEDYAKLAYEIADAMLKLRGVA